MIFQIDNAIISDEILKEKFCCNLSVCKGACCVEGDSGAPLTEEEHTILKSILPELLPLLSEEGKKVIEKDGLAVVDEDGDLVTPLIGDKADCAYVLNEKGVTYCAIERAYNLKLVPFRKPISCHLYPIRISESGKYKLLNYHRWAVCASAVEFGKKEGVYMYEMLREPLIREFGEEWYAELCLAAESLRNEKQKSEKE